MQRILIIGSPGSGKSTLARYIAEKLDIPCVYLDMLFWNDNWRQTPRDEFDLLIRNELEKESWIIDGNYARTLPLRIKYADTVIWLKYPRIVCMWRAFLRQGRKRPDLPETCVEKRDKEFFEFLGYIWNFPKENDENIQKLLSESKADIFVIRNNKQLKDFKDKIERIGIQK